MSDKEITPTQLNKLLDEHGLSKDAVRRRRLFWDMMSYFTSPVKGQVWYISGSIREGLIKIDYNESDLDIMTIYTDAAAVDKRSRDPVNVPESIEIYFQLKNTRNPGFKYLTYREFSQVDDTGIGRWKTVTLDNDYLSVFKYVDSTLLCRQHVKGCKTMANLVDLLDMRTAQGPACNVSDSKFRPFDSFDMDIVPAVKCLQFPEEAKEWWYRGRPFNWPSQDTIDHITSIKCHLVGIGSDPESKKEWRISFSMAEHILIHSLNEAQLKCYALLKLFIKSMVKPKVPNVLCSYHMKTLMFWLCEGSSISFWKKECLTDCFIFCLKELKERVRFGRCCHYFIRKVNLFQRKLNSRNAEQIVEIIDTVLTKKCTNLYKKIPERTMNWLKFGVHMGFLLHATLRRDMLSIESFTSALTSYKGENIPELLKAYFRDVSRDICINENVIAACPTLFEFTAKSIHLAELIDSNLTNKVWYRETKPLLKDLYRLSRYDLCSGKLKLATIYWKLNKLESCMRLCSSVIEVLNNNKMRVNFSFRYDALAYFKRIANLVYLDRYLLPNQLMSQSINRDVVFTPLEIGLLPEAVQLEMIREKEYLFSVRHDLPTKCWCYFDPIVYAYYLLVICHHQVGQTVERDMNLHLLEDVFYHKHDECYLVYPEAALLLIKHCRELSN